jgi:hypothetical protein
VRLTTVTSGNNSISPDISFGHAGTAHPNNRISIAAVRMSENEHGSGYLKVNTPVITNQTVMKQFQSITYPMAGIAFHPPDKTTADRNIHKQILIRPAGC